jgi:hypothetical protein
MAAPNLLNDDGTASMATAFMLSHHAFRRDLQRFLWALERNSLDDATLRAEWEWYRTALHGHHTQEDTGIFPGLKQQHPKLAATVDRLIADHHHIDPILARADAAFADLPKQRMVALSLLRDLSLLLATHLALEEAEIVPTMRNAKEFPAPPNEEMAAMYAQGFAWASNGIAPDILAQLDKMLPPILKARLPAAREAFNTRVARHYPIEMPLASRTPVPWS